LQENFERLILPYRFMKKEKLPLPTEHQIQCAFIEWCIRSETAHPELRLAFSVPNGGARHIVTATKLKREGSRAGVPDWILPFPVLPYIGLAIEFKRGEKGVISASQEDYIALLRSAGWRVEICRNSESAISIVRDYLRRKP
jgi:hypothetical protein